MGKPAKGAEMEIKAVVFDFGGVMTTSTMPQRVIELAKEKGRWLKVLPSVSSGVQTDRRRSS